MDGRGEVDGDEVPKERLPKAPARRRRPEDVKARIMTAAVNLFATHGFEGTSTRLIANDANVSLSLLLYHFQSKEQLWRAAIEHLMGDLSPFGSEAPSSEASTTEQLRALIRSTVMIFARVPELHRIMTLEAHQSSERLAWLCENHIKEDFKRVCNLIVAGQKEGKVRKVNPARLRYAIIAIAAVPFSVSAEYQYLTGRDPFSAAEIENAIDFINRIVFEDE